LGEIELCAKSTLQDFPSCVSPQFVSKLNCFNKRHSMLWHYSCSDLHKPCFDTDLWLLSMWEYCRQNIFQHGS